VTRVVWLNGCFVDRADARLSIDDPAVRSGEGLFETMRGQDGGVPWLDRHLARLERSIAALRLAPMPDPADVRDAVIRTAARIDRGPARIRLTVTPNPTLIVEATPIILDPAKTLTAVTVRGAWHPDRRAGEHKTLSFLDWRAAQRRAEASDADLALLLDAEGRLGEGSTANVFCVIGGGIVTAPVRGLLPGVTRAVVMELADVREEAMQEETWRNAGEMFATSAVRGVVPIVACDGRPVGSGAAGPVTEGLRAAIDAEFNLRPPSHHGVASQEADTPISRPVRRRCR
jgi:branched-subunit amino acid aminotransferase/4-amino-4-deoxychorismate lyase